MKAPKGEGGGRPASGSLSHSMDLGRAPEEMVVVRGQEEMALLGSCPRSSPLHR